MMANGEQESVWRVFLRHLPEVLVCGFVISQVATQTIPSTQPAGFRIARSDVDPVNPTKVLIRDGSWQHIIEKPKAPAVHTASAAPCLS